MAGPTVEHSAVLTDSARADSRAVRKAILSAENLAAWMVVSLADSKAAQKAMTSAARLVGR